ncbi:MAG: LamG domain-containing protein [Cyclobacteriaceae bacterium]|nr:LamG domain-containing protein [Cyclobacteriaceae bacterium]
MRTIKNILAAITIMGMVGACNEGIDPISAVAPGPDETAPVITVTYPNEGTEIKVAETLVSINIKFEVTDDIEIKNIVVKMDGNNVATFTDFPDYRRAVKDVLYEGLTTGEHVLTIVATDMENKVTTRNINFEKKPPYIPIFAGEIFYMPFDGIYTELISITNPTVVGSPQFAGEGKRGGNAYKGVTNAYLTYPTAGLLGTEFSASFWMKVDANPDRAGVLVAGPPGINTRTQGFRFFRENAGGKQRFKLNVGNGTSDFWFDGGTNADVVPNTNEWVHFAFSISATNAAVYINGQVASQGPLTGGVNWAGCDVLSIMSGATRFTEWGHLSDQSKMDELRLFNKALTQADVLAIIGSDYTPKYAGEVLYMPFNSDFSDLVGGSTVTTVGSPALAGQGKAGGNSYKGVANSYLTYPTTNLTKTNQFSAVFWLKVNASPDRAGILVMGPPGDNIRTHGFRFFRENAGGKQRFKLNVGNGTADSWFDGGTAADVDPTGNPWVHLAFTISGSQCTVYINGVIASQGAFTGVNWTGCDVLSIMSGAPRFMEWGHLSDESFMDELRIFDKALTQAEVQTIMNE